MRMGLPLVVFFLLTTGEEPLEVVPFLFPFEMGFCGLRFDGRAEVVFAFVIVRSILVGRG